MMMAVSPGSNELNGCSAAGLGELSDDFMASEVNGAVAMLSPIALFAKEVAAMSEKKVRHMKPPWRIQPLEPPTHRRINKHILKRRQSRKRYPDALGLPEISGTPPFPLKVVTHEEMQIKAANSAKRQMDTKLYDRCSEMRSRFTIINGVLCEFRRETVV